MNSLNSMKRYGKTRMNQSTSSLTATDLCALTTITTEFFTNTSWQCWYHWQLCVPTCLHFSALFTSTDVSKCEIRNLRACEDYILRSSATLDWLVFNERAKTKLAMLAILYCGEIVKNSISQTNSGQ